MEEKKRKTESNEAMGALSETQASQVVNEMVGKKKGATNHHSCALRGPTFSYPLCPNCSKHHQGECSVRGGCYNCGETGHTQKVCPKGDTLPQKASHPQRMSSVDAEYLPCDPKSLPKYESSHEFQTKKKRPQQRENKDMAKIQKLPYPQRHTRFPPILQSGQVHHPPQQQLWMGGSNLGVNNNLGPPYPSGPSHHHHHHYGNPPGHCAYQGSQPGHCTYPPPQGGAHYHGNVLAGTNVHGYGAPPNYSSHSSQHGGGGGPPNSRYSSAGFTHITVVHYNIGAYPPPNYSSQSSQHGGLGVGSGRGLPANGNHQYGGWQQ